MKKVIVGNHAVSYGVKLSRVEVISAYPITPQTYIVEELSEMCANGSLDARFIKVESEHSALACLLGASEVGARCFTATSAQGLALMHEVLHYAAGARLPIVMANVNRALAPGWSIWTDQNDSLSQRDTGWLQLYCESNQEVIDTVIQAFKIAENTDVMLPVMIVLDAFVLSHTAEPVEIPDQDKVDQFLPKRVAPYKLDPKEPHAFNGLVTPDDYMEMRYDMQLGMDSALQYIPKVVDEWEASFGRRWDIVEPIYMDDADIVLVTSGTVTSLARIAAEELREQGEKVGILKMKLFRPFPVELVQKYLAGRKKVAIIDRNFSFGMGGIWTQEIKRVMFNVSNKPQIQGYIVGLGGRDITPQTIKDIYNNVKELDKPQDRDIWIGLKDHLKHPFKVKS